jgi:hypothetical protein
LKIPVLEEGLAFVILFAVFLALALLTLGRDGAEPAAASANAMTRRCVVALLVSGDANASYKARACFAKWVPL